jgi:uncharacterized membrane-anchored protein
MFTNAGSVCTINTVVCALFLICMQVSVHIVVETLLLHMLSQLAAPQYHTWAYKIAIAVTSILNKSCKGVMTNACVYITSVACTFER